VGVVPELRTARWFLWLRKMDNDLQTAERIKSHTGSNLLKPNTEGKKSRMVLTGKGKRSYLNNRVIFCKGGRHHGQLKVSAGKWRSTLLEGGAKGKFLRKVCARGKEEIMATNGCFIEGRKGGRTWWGGTAAYNLHGL